MKGKISGEVGGGWGRLIANETASSNLPEPPLNLLFQFCQPVFYRAIARELSRHRLQNRQGAVPHAGEGERVGAEQPDPEPEEAAGGRGRERRQCRQGRFPVLLVHNQRFDDEQSRARILGVALRQLADQLAGATPPRG